jgi:hypothetical protein
MKLGQPINVPVSACYEMSFVTPVTIGFALYFIQFSRKNLRNMVTNMLSKLRLIVGP